MPPLLQSVYSSNVEKLGHDPETGELHVQWSSGKTSIYSNVPTQVAEDVRTSWSVGQAVNQMVKGKFQHRYGGSE